MALHFHRHVCKARHTLTGRWYDHENNSFLAKSHGDSPALTATEGIVIQLSFQHVELVLIGDLPDGTVFVAHDGAGGHYWDGQGFNLPKGSALAPAFLTGEEKSRLGRLHPAAVFEEITLKTLE